MDNQNKPLITVVTVCYNAVNELEETMLSVLNQTYDNIEYIVIDGGSTDGTVDIIKKYADRLAYWVSEPDKGIYDAMNKGISVATGEWINFMNAGDRFYDEGTIERMSLSFCEKETIYYGDAWIHSIGKKYWGRFSSWKLATGNICHQAIFYPSSLLKQNLFDTSYCIFADYVFNLDAWKKYPFEYVPRIICRYDFGGASTLNKNRDKKFICDRSRLVINSCGFVNYCIGSIYRTLIKIKSGLK